MKNGFRVYDSDTHVNPAAEVLERYVDPGFRPRLAELEPYRFAVGEGAVGGVAGLHNYRVGTKYYRRVLGEKAPRGGSSVEVCAAALAVASCADAPAGGVAASGAVAESGLTPEAI